jgi:aminoglycoside phosphotransferase (APT) family kinase protein
MEPDIVDWLATALPDDQVTSATPLHGGYRNDNRLLTTARGGRYVLRRCPRATIEAALLRRLRGTVPVAGVVANGPGLLLSTFVPGEPLSLVLARGGGDAELAAAVGRALVAIGTVEFAASGFFTDDRLEPTGELPADLAAFVTECLSTEAGMAALTIRERAALLALARERQPLLDRAAGVNRLVHSDFNPKNIMVDRQDGQWLVTAVLDWEFAYSGNPLADVGNMLRFSDDLSSDYADGFLGVLRSARRLPEDWRELAETLDLFALAELMSRPGALRDRVIEVVRRRCDAAMA